MDAVGLSCKKSTLLLWPIQQLGDSWTQKQEDDQMMMNYFTLVYGDLELLMWRKNEEFN